MIRVNKDNFDEEVLKADKPVLLDFYADWCGPCQMLMPIMEEIANEVTEVKICKINVDEEADLAQQYKVRNIPTLILLENGEIKEKSIGGKSKAEILAMIKQ